MRIARESEVTNPIMSALLTRLKLKIIYSERGRLIWNKLGQLSHTQSIMIIDHIFKYRARSSWPTQITYSWSTDTGYGMNEMKEKL